MISVGRVPLNTRGRVEIRTDLWPFEPGEGARLERRTRKSIVKKRSFL